MAESTLRRFSGLTSGRSLSTRDTVLTLTPHCRAISLMVIYRASSPSWAIPQRGNITGNVPDRLRYYFTNFRVLCQWCL